jgi:hypothetical protein
VALKDSLAAFAQPAPLLLQALLNGLVIAQLLAAKALRVPRARLLLLRRAEMALGNRKRGSVIRTTVARTTRRMSGSPAGGWE